MKDMVMNNNLKIYLLTFMTFLMGTAQFVIVGILDKIAASAGVSLAVAGQLITAFSLANAIGTPIVIFMTAKADQRFRLVLALVFILIGSVLTMVPGFSSLLVSRVMLGIGNGFFTAIAYFLAPKLASPGREVGAMSNVALGFSASLVFGVPLGRVIASFYDWTAIFWGIGFFTIVGIFAVIRTIPPIRGEEAVSLGEQLSLLKNRKIAVALGVTLAVFIGYSVVNTYITPLLTSVMSVAQEQVSAVLFVLGIASMIGSGLAGFLADRIGNARTLVIGLAAQTISLTLLSFSGQIIVLGMPSLILWAISAWMFVPPQNFRLLSLAPGAGSIVLGLSNTFVQLGFAAGAAIGGLIVGEYSLITVVWIGVALLAAATVVTAASSGSVRSFAKA